jgi:predicted DNA-binding protein
MALELHDIRCKLPTDLNAVLDAIAEATGREKSVIVREYVEARLIEELHRFRLIHSELKAIGMLSLIQDGQGITGKK